jgi:hypothetical protein
MADERILQIGFEVFVSEVKKFEDEGVFNRFFWSHAIAGRGDACLSQQGGFVSGERDALIKPALDLPGELADRPS